MSDAIIPSINNTASLGDSNHILQNIYCSNILVSTDTFIKIILSEITINNKHPTIYVGINTNNEGFIYINDVLDTEDKLYDLKGNEVSLTI